MTPLSLTVGTVLVALLGALWLRRSFVVVTVDGQSMEPTFTAGDRVLARRSALRRVKSGDVVVVGDSTIRDDDLPVGSLALIIKRVAAVPGDAIPRQTVPALASAPGSTVPPGKLVLLGDNPVSSDSRQVGYFDGSWLVGRAVGRLTRA
jgi:signal peptidase I